MLCPMTEKTREGKCGEGVTEAPLGKSAPWP